MENPQSRTFVLRETLLSQRPDPLAAVAMALASFVVTVLSLLAWKDVIGAASWMPASRGTVWGGQEYWRAWTTLLVHGDAKHLLSNIFLFFILGTFLSGYFGISLVLGAAFFAGGVVNLVVLADMPVQTQLIGLSGVVFWMGGAWLALYCFIDRKRSRTQRGIRALGVTLALFMPAEAFDPSVSYRSHLVGFLLGVAAGILYFAVFKKSVRSAEVWEAVPEEDETSATTPESP